MKKQTLIWVIIALFSLILALYSIYNNDDNKKIIFTGQGDEWKAQMIMTIKGGEVSELLEIKYLGSDPENIGAFFSVMKCLEIVEAADTTWTVQLKVLLHVHKAKEDLYPTILKTA